MISFVLEHSLFLFVVGDERERRKEARNWTGRKNMEKGYVMLDRLVFTDILLSNYSYCTCVKSLRHVNEVFMNLTSRMIVLQGFYIIRKVTTRRNLNIFLFSLVKYSQFPDR